MIKWIKPSGVEVETNDHKDNIAMAESLRWKRAELKQEPVARRTRRTKEQMEADSRKG